jgi:hypothetical protein
MGYGITAFRTDYGAVRRFFTQHPADELKRVLRQRKAIAELNELFEVGVEGSSAMPVEQAVEDLGRGRVAKPTTMHAYAVQLVVRSYGAQLASGLWERTSVKFFSRFDDLLTERCELTGADRLHKALGNGLDMAMNYQSGFPDWGHYVPAKVRMLHDRLRKASFEDDRDPYQQQALVDFRRWVRTADNHGHALFMFYD